MKQLFIELREFTICQRPFIDPEVINQTIKRLTNNQLLRFYFRVDFRSQILAINPNPGNAAFLPAKGNIYIFSLTDFMIAVFEDTITPGNMQIKFRINFKGKVLIV